jgi:hypothetical protein
MVDFLVVKVKIVLSVSAENRAEVVPGVVGLSQVRLLPQVH